MSLALSPFLFAFALVPGASSQLGVADVEATSVFSPINTGRFNVVHGSARDEVAVNRGRFWCLARYDASSLVLESFYASPFFAHATNPASSNYILWLEVGDVLGDAGLEVVTLYEDRTVRIHDVATRALMSSFTAAQDYPDSLLLHDLDGDAKAEIVVSDSYGLAVQSAAGAVMWTFSGSVGERLIAGQFDDDAAQEIVAESGVVIDAATHAEQWSFPTAAGQLVAADIDDDGKLEWIAGWESDQVRAIDVDTQSVKWSFAAGNLDALAIGDIEGDGREELFEGVGGSGFVHVFDATNGTPLGIIDGPNFDFSDLELGDFDGDGALEVLMPAKLPSNQPTSMSVADAATRAIEWSNLVLGPIAAGPVRGDVDGDGTDEVVVVCNGSIVTGRIVVLDGASLSVEAISQPIANGQFSSSVVSVALVDADADGAREIAVGSQQSGAIAEVFDYSPPNGFTRIWTNATQPASAAFSAVAVEDVDADGDLEVLCGTDGTSSAFTTPCVYVYDYGTQALEWTTPALGPAGFLMPVRELTLTDADHDGVDELVVFRAGDGVFVIDVATRTIESGVRGPFRSAAFVTLGSGAGGLFGAITGDDVGDVRRHVLTTSGWQTSSATTFASWRIEGLAWDPRRSSFASALGRIERHPGLAATPVWTSAAYGVGSGDFVTLVFDGDAPLHLVSATPDMVVGF
ncbi:MAG: hypothetical protein HZA52_03450 [Planctomycetes bacterium]|nr:hypothetical protein [Planctomycetota bacterium]